MTNTILIAEVVGAAVAIFAVCIMPRKWCFSTVDRHAKQMVSSPNTNEGAEHSSATGYAAAELGWFIYDNRFAFEAIDRKALCLVSDLSDADRMWLVGLLDEAGVRHTSTEENLHIRASYGLILFATARWAAARPKPD